MKGTPATDTTYDELSRLLSTPVVWKLSDRGRGTYESVVDGQEVLLERDLFNYPEQGLFKLYRGNEYLGCFDSWPWIWRHESRLGTLWHRLAWTRWL